MIMAPACLDEEQLAGYLEGSLSEVERDRVERHLADCEKCLDEFVLSRNMVQGSSVRGARPCPRQSHCICHQTDP